MLPALRGASVLERTLYWEHTGNSAIRLGRWKLVRDYPKAWELYDIEQDRTELHDLSAQNADVVAALSQEWDAWAARVGVIPWQVTLDLYAERGQPAQGSSGMSTRPASQCPA